jgi:hypothetical protein
MIAKTLVLLAVSATALPVERPTKSSTLALAEESNPSASLVIGVAGNKPPVGYTKYLGSFDGVDDVTAALQESAAAADSASNAFHDERHALSHSMEEQRKPEQPQVALQSTRDVAVDEDVWVPIVDVEKALSQSSTVSNANKPENRPRWLRLADESDSKAAAEADDVLRLMQQSSKGEAAESVSEAATNDGPPLTVVAIATSAGGLVLLLCCFFTVRWWWRTPNHKQPWSPKTGHPHPRNADLHVSRVAKVDLFGHKNDDGMLLESEPKCPNGPVKP